MAHPGCDASITARTEVGFCCIPWHNKPNLGIVTGGRVEHRPGPQSSSGWRPRRGARVHTGTSSILPLACSPFFLLSTLLRAFVEFDPVGCQFGLLPRFGRFAGTVSGRHDNPQSDLAGERPDDETDDHHKSGGDEEVVEGGRSMLSMRIETHRSSMVPKTDLSTTSQSGRSLTRAPAMLLLPLLIGLGAALSSCAGEVPAVPTDDAQLVQGREIYLSKCAACHGADGSGRTGSKLNEGVVVANFPDPDDEFDVIANGKDRMPAYGGSLSAEEIEAVVRFTREGL